MSILRSALVALVLLAAAPAAAEACSIVRGPLPEVASDPRALVDTAERASFAVVEEATAQGDDVTYRLRTQRNVRGTFAETVVVRDEGDLCLGETTYAPGTRVGLVDDEVLDAETLERALRPYPQPRRSGEAVLVVGGRFGDATVAALDRAGRVLLYGFGGPRAVVLDVCPGGERVVQADAERIAVRRTSDMAVVRTVRLERSGFGVRCLDRRGARLAAELGGRRGGVALVQGGAVRRVRGGRVLALGDRGALLGFGTRMVEQAYRGGARRPAGALPPGVLDAAATPDLQRVLLEAPEALTFRDRRTGFELTRRLPRRDEDGPVGPRPATTLGFDPAGRPFVGFRDRLRGFDARFGAERVLGGGELHGTVGTEAWGKDFEGGLWRGRRRIGTAVRLDAGPFAALPRPITVEDVEARTP